MEDTLAVIIPVYNGEFHIQRCINSCLLSSSLDEVIVVDDGSIDNTAAIVTSMQEVDNRIKFYQHPDGKNHGISASRNLGLKKAQSQWITFCDADDYYLSNRFEAFDRSFLVLFKPDQ